MRAARVFRRELDLWSTAWQQIETFLERIDGARDSDDPHRRKVEALLRVADVVERRRAISDPGAALSPPVVDALPSRHWDPAIESIVPTPAETAWSPELRRWRVPGTDEIELAVAQLRTSGQEDDLRVLDEVRLPRDRAIFTRAVRAGDPPALLRLPAYPSGPAGSIAAGGRTVDVAAEPNADTDTASLFSQSRRYEATTADLPGLETEDDDEVPPDPVLAWSALCGRRRGASRTGGVPVSTGSGGAAPLASGATATASVVVAGLRSGAITPSAAAPLLAGVAATARQVAAGASPDVAQLEAAALVLDAEGCRTTGLPGTVRAAAAALGGSADAWLALATAADTLGLAPFSAAARTGVDTAIAALSAAAVPDLLASAVEAGSLRADLDEATGARVGYPDGALRVLRTLEVGFASGWRGWLRWFRLRHTVLLQPLADRSRAPFVAGVRALVNGGDTGLVYQGLTLGDNVTVGADTVPTAQPASLALSLDELEPGTVGVVPGDRPAAVVVLGVDRLAGRLALNVSPLRVSTAPGAPGSSGVVPGGAPIEAVAAGFAAAELRVGESAAGAAADGPLHETVALWSRLCLVYGRDLVDAEIAGLQGLRSVPEPSTVPLQTVSLHGSVPGYATSLVIAGLGPAFWDLVDGEPFPLIARPGELLLLRGRVSAEDGGAGGATAGPMVQAVVEVERVVRTTASMLDRMDTSSAGVLATDPAALPDPSDGGTPCVVCGPEEDVAVVVLRRSWSATSLVAEVSLRRDFAGFDLPSLATKRLLPLDFLTQVTGRSAADLAGPVGVDRADEFTAALEIFGSWTHYALTEVG